MDNMSSELLKFCLEHSDGNVGPTQLPQRDPADYKWLRAALDDLESDFMRMKKLIDIIKSNSDETSQSRALEELQFIVEDYDNGIDFWKVPDVKYLIDLVKTSGEEIKSWIMWVFATAVQNNSESQEKAVNAGVLDIALELAKQDASDRVLSKTISVLSALVKGDEQTVQKFVQAGGYDLVNGYVNNPKLSPQTLTKVVFLLKYLLYRHRVDVWNSMKKNDMVRKLIVLGNLDHVDLREKVLELMQEMLKDEDIDAKEEFKKNDVKNFLQERINVINSATGERKERSSEEQKLCENLQQHLSS